MQTTEKTENQTARLNFRLPSEIKERVESAALASGVTVTDFAISALANTADAVLEKQRARKLSDRDAKIFLAMLDDESEPNEALKKAAARYKERMSK